MKKLKAKYMVIETREFTILKALTDLINACEDVYEFIPKKEIDVDRLDDKDYPDLEYAYAVGGFEGAVKQAIKVLKEIKHTDDFKASFRSEKRVKRHHEKMLGKGWEKVLDKSEQNTEKPEGE